MSNGGTVMVEPRKLEPNFQDRITTNPNFLVGKAVIKGTRIPVYLILNLLAHDYSFERIVEAYPILTSDDIRAALAYASVRLDHVETGKLK
jgi:uncharacterized protein (DUF433 family)